MSPIRALFTACCLFAFLLAGCGKGSNDSANVRVVNLISGASNVTVTVGGTPILTGGNFEAIGPYTGTGTGNQEFKVTVPGSTGALLDTVYGIGNTDYTYVTSGTPGAAAAVLVADPYGSPGGNTFAVRVLDMTDGKTVASYDYNLDVTRKVVEMAHAMGVTVEGELGCLGSLETMKGDKEDGHGAEGTMTREMLLTDPDQAADFVRKTQLDALAIAIGTSHGLRPVTCDA